MVDWSIGPARGKAFDSLLQGFQYCDPWDLKLKIEKQKVVFERKKFPIFQIRNMNLKNLLIFFLRIKLIWNWKLSNFQTIKSVIFELNRTNFEQIPVWLHPYHIGNISNKLKRLRHRLFAAPYYWMLNFFHSFVTRKDIGFGKVVAFLLDLPIGTLVNQTTYLDLKIVASCIMLRTFINGMTLVVVWLIVANLYAKFYLENYYDFENVWCIGHIG